VRFDLLDGFTSDSVLSLASLDVRFSTFSFRFSSLVFEDLASWVFSWEYLVRRSFLAESPSPSSPFAAAFPWP
jgi:hypothetical protein